MTDPNDVFEFGEAFPLPINNPNGEIGATMTQEIIDFTPLTPEISPGRASFYADRDPSKTYALFCGDDRNPTVASSDHIAQELGVDREVYLRYYGGAAGLARVTAVTIAAQYGGEALANYGSSFVDFTAETRDRVERTSKVILGAHSAEANEGNAVKLDTSSEKTIGCAYCAGVGAVSCLCAPNGGLVDLAKKEQTELFGDNGLVDVIADANQVVINQFFPKEKDSFSLGREDLDKIGMPVSILEGSHALAKDVVVIENFLADKISVPAQANAADQPSYNNDVTAVAEMIMKAYPELKLKPAILLAAADHDIRATRAALASHENLPPEAMKVERYGNPKEAIAYLEALQI